MADIDNTSGLAAPNEGKLAERILLQDARLVWQSGKKIFYQKEGGYKQALEDFKAVNPLSVLDRFVHHGRVAKSGMIGDRQMTLLRDEWANPATLEITKIKDVTNAGKDYAAKIILYYD